MTGDGNWTWLVGGRRPTLIDAGTGEAGHLSALRDALGGTTLAQVIVTHAHVDHVSGAPALANVFPDAAFLKMPWPERDSRWPVAWKPIRDRDVIQAGDTALTVVHTPGHAPDHVCLWHPETRTVFSADLAVQGTTVYIPSKLRGDLIEYLASLKRILDLSPIRLLPAHGPVIDDPRRMLQSYIDHRHEREAQIVDALRSGCHTPDAIVARVYRGLKPAMVPLAQESVEAHLTKLAREGRARVADERWHIIEP